MIKPSYAVWLCFVFCQILWSLLETCHTLMIKITYTSTHIANTTIHPQNKTPSSIMTLSPRLPSRIWAIQKEIKDAYPKKVRHVPKRHEKKECQEKRKDAYPKKVCNMSQDMSKKREAIHTHTAHVQEKNTERDRSSNEVQLSTKNIPHTCTSWSGCMTRFYLDLAFDLTIQEKKHASYPYPELHISLIRW